MHTGNETYLMKKEDIFKYIVDHPEMTYLEVANAHGIKKSQVHYIAKKYNLPRRTRAEYWTKERRQKVGAVVSKRWTEERKRNQSEFLKRAWNLRK